jgi:DNA-binding transcriptional regulator YiaG
MKPDVVVLDIRESDRDVVLVTASGSWGTVTLMGSVRFEARTIYSTGSISVEARRVDWGEGGLTRSPGSCWRNQVPTKLSFREALERAAATRDEPPEPSAFPTQSVLLEAGEMPQPVAVAVALRSHGLSLKRAHATLNKLAEFRIAVAEMPEDLDLAVLNAELADLGVVAKRIAAPTVDPAQVRSASGLSQADFARMFAFEVDTIQNWEQGRNSIDKAARVYLKIIEAFPEIPQAILTGTERGLVVQRVGGTGDRRTAGSKKHS